MISQIDIAKIPTENIFFPINLIKILIGLILKKTSRNNIFRDVCQNHINQSVN